MHSWMTTERLRELIVNLQVIGQLEEGYKLNTKEKYLELDNTTWYQSVVRWYRGDSRKTTINKIYKTVSDTCAVIDETIFQYKLNTSVLIMDLSCEIFMTTMLSVVEIALKGLRHLKNTYNYDITVKAQLDFDILAFEQKVKEIKRILQTPAEPRKILPRQKSESL